MQTSSADPEAGPISAPLLCCICQDKNTTFRYEVVYKQANKSITILDITDVNKEELGKITKQHFVIPTGINETLAQIENFSALCLFIFGHKSNKTSVTCEKIILSSLK